MADEPYSDGVDTTDELIAASVMVGSRMAKLEHRQFELEARVEDLADTVEQSAGDVTQAMRALRGELLGERRALATSAIFAAVGPALDALGAMRSEPGSAGDGAVHAQIRATAGALTNVLQSLGFSAFECEPGAAFDAARMEVLGYGEGDGDGVLASVRPGYMAGDAVVRPAGVLVADPHAGPAPDIDAPAAHPTHTTGG